MASPELCRVNVNIRARPLNNREKSESARLCLQFFPGTNKLKVGDKIFVFDNVFPPESKQDEVYEESAGPLLEKFFKGYNCCLLAYGQTGAGKTHTMGTEETKESMHSSARGVIPRIASGLFEMIESSSQPSSYAVSVSMLEVYQDDVVDLLSGNKDNLQIREKSGSVFVQGLSQSSVGSLEDTMTELEKGCLVRTKGSTAMNATSSRSHAVFTIHLSKTAVDESECSFTAKFHMVDLAGSERLKKTQAEGERKREGIKINEGLLALGNVISALAEGSRHIPYRDSKITRILQDSLGGNSMTVMIACISPADTNAEETLSTLRYAERTKKIENNAQVNVDPQQALLVQLREENLRLRAELSQLKGDGAPMQLMSATNAVNNGLASAQEALVLDKKLQKMDLQLAEMAAQKLVLQSQLCKAEEIHERMVHNMQELYHDDEKGAEAKLDILKKIIEEINSTAEESQVEPMDTDGDEANTNGEEADDGEDSDEHDETFAQKFIQRQDNLSKEMEAVLTQIREKELLIAKSTVSDSVLNEMKQKFESEVSELQSRIDAIQAERDKLSEQLKKVSNSSKISEERRKKLQDLEKQLSTHKKKLVELHKLQTWKKQNEDNARRMRKEIEDLKTLRVKLMKQMRVESDQYRQWKNKHERELARVKNKEKRLEVEFARTKQSYSKQLAVFQRKYQEAAACNKRLQQQIFSSQTAKNEPLNDAKLKDQLRKFIEEELKLEHSAYEAETHSTALIDRRKEISKKLSRARVKKSRLEAEPATKSCASASPMSLMMSPASTASPSLLYDKESSPPSTPEHGLPLPLRLLRNESRRTLSDGSHVEDENAVKAVDEEIEALNKEIEMCTEEIHNQQKHCGSIDLEARADTRWSNIRTLDHARAALKLLFESAASTGRSVVDLTCSLDDKEQELRDLKKLLEEEKEKHVDEAQRLAKNFQEQAASVKGLYADTEGKLLVLLSNVMDNCAMSHDQFTELKNMYESLNRGQQENHKLDEDVNHAKRRVSKVTSSGRSLARSTSAMQIGPLEPMDRAQRTARVLAAGKITKDVAILDQQSFIAEEGIDQSYVPDLPRGKPRRKKFQAPSPIRAAADEDASKDRRRSAMFDFEEGKENTDSPEASVAANSTFVKLPPLLENSTSKGSLGRM